MAFLKKCYQDVLMFATVCGFPDMHDLSVKMCDSNP